MRLLGHAVTDLAILFCSFLVVYAISFQKQPISYSLVINPSSLFSIRSETGEISLTRTLDYESDQRRYLLMVRASEDSSSLSAAAEVGLKNGVTPATSINYTFVVYLHCQYFKKYFFKVKHSLHLN